MKCPYCQNGAGQIKAGLNKSGSQRYRCKACQRRYRPSPKQHGYSSEIRQKAIQKYVDGMNLRRISRMPGVDHHTVINFTQVFALAV